jgi:hypothetical protein
MFPDQLTHYFRRLYLVDNDKFDLEKLLSTFVKQGYLDKQKTSDQSQNSEKEPLEYRWGPRAKIEMPENNLNEFIRAVSVIIYINLSKLISSSKLNVLDKNATLLPIRIGYKGYLVFNQALQIEHP